MRIALTGGIASGKTTAADELRRLGVPVIDYDQLSRDVVAPGTPGFEAVKQAFGPSVLAKDGSLDRAILAQIVFKSPDARQFLEAIVHPLVFQAADRADAAAVAAGHDFVVHEIPLLVETMDPSAFDGVIVVEAPAWLRGRRLGNERGMTMEQANQRLTAQASDVDRAAVADFIWDGSGTPEALRAQVRDWVDLMKETAG